MRLLPKLMLPKLRLFNFWMANQNYVAWELDVDANSWRVGYRFQNILK